MKKKSLIDFGRQALWNCPIPENEGKPLYNDSEETNKNRPQKIDQTDETSIRVQKPQSVANRDAWLIPPIQCDEPEDGVFYAQMGPTGGIYY